MSELKEICEKIIDTIGNGELAFQEDVKEIQILTELIKMRADKKKLKEISALHKVEGECEDLMCFIEKRVSVIRESLEEALQYLEE